MEPGVGVRSVWGGAGPSVHMVMGVLRGSGLPSCTCAAPEARARCWCGPLAPAAGGGGRPGWGMGRDREGATQESGDFECE